MDNQTFKNLESQSSDDIVQNPGPDTNPGSATAVQSKPTMEYDEVENQRHGLHFVIGFTISQILGILCVTLVWVWTGHYLQGFAWHSDLSKQFNYHPLFMVISLVFLYGDAILVYRVLKNTTKLRLKLLHAGIHTLAFCFAVVALTAVFDTHNLAKPPIANVYSLHSWIGLTTVVLYAMQFVFGFVTFLFPGLARTVRSSYLPLHTFFGLVIFVMAIAACLTGMMEKIHWTIEHYQDREAPSYLVNFLGLSLITFGAVVVYLVTQPQFKRKPLPEEAALNMESSTPMN